MSCGGLSSKEKDNGKKGLEVMKNYNDIDLKYQISDLNVHFDKTTGIFHCNFLFLK